MERRKSKLYNDVSQEEIENIKNEIPLERIGKTVDISRCVQCS